MLPRREPLQVPTGEARSPGLSPFIVSRPGPVPAVAGRAAFCYKRTVSRTPVAQKDRAAVS